VSGHATPATVPPSRDCHSKLFRFLRHNHRNQNGLVSEFSFSGEVATATSRQQDRLPDFALLQHRQHRSEDDSSRPHTHTGPVRVLERRLYTPPDIIDHEDEVIGQIRSRMWHQEPASQGFLTPW